MMFEKTEEGRRLNLYQFAVLVLLSCLACSDCNFLFICFSLTQDMGTNAETQLERYESPISQHNLPSVDSERKQEKIWLRKFIRIILRPTL